MPDQSPQSRIQGLGQLVGRIRDAGQAAVDIVLGRPFNPNLPIRPMVSPAEQHGGPRSYDYRVAQNLILQPRSDFPELTSFDQLRNMARLNDVASLCINTRIEELASLDWSIKAKNKQEQAKYEDAGVIDYVTAFWQKPSAIEPNFANWLKKLTRDTLEIDAMALYVQRKENGLLYSLEPVAGDTIKPLIDDRGRTLAYQQIIKGLAASNYIAYGMDKPDEIMPMPFPGFEGEEWPQELIYRPKNVRTDSPYGMAPVEFVVMRVNMALRKQSYDMAYFTDGNTPEMLLSPAEGMMNVDQVEEFETYFNALLAGNDGARRRAKFLAWAANPTLLKPFSYDPALDELMIKLICAAFDVTPAEIGFTDDVNRASSEGQENVQFRKGIKPLAKWFKALFDEIIAMEFGFPGLEFAWDFGESQDSLQQAQVDHIYITDGVLQPQEVRAMRFSDEVDQNPQPQQPKPPALPQPTKQRQIVNVN